MEFVTCEPREHGRSFYVCVCVCVEERAKWVRCTESFQFRFDCFTCNGFIEGMARVLNRFIANLYTKGWRDSLHGQCAYSTLMHYSPRQHNQSTQIPQVFISISEMGAVAKQPVCRNVFFSRTMSKWNDSHILCSSFWLRRTPFRYGIYGIIIIINRMNEPTRCVCDQHYFGLCTI